MAREIRSEIEVHAPIEHVWRVLVDFARYSEWNPFIKEARGSAKTDERLQVTVKPPGLSPMSFSPRVRVADPPNQLRWLGRVGVPGVFDGDHRFDLVRLGPERTRVIQFERFSGLLVPLMKKQMYEATQVGFHESLAALKRRAETTVLPAAPPVPSSKPAKTVGRLAPRTSPRAKGRRK